MSNNCYNSELPMGPQGPTGPPGPPGPQGNPGTNGTNGTNGNTVLSGLIPPTTEGVNGDYYIDTTTDTIYGPKTLGVWGSGTSLVGPPGTPGTPGTPGSNGSPGVPGSNGSNGNNAYSLTGDLFAQPAINSSIIQIEVTDYSWMSFNQVVFVGNPTGTSDIGGYYLLTNKYTITGVNYIDLYRLDWTIPGVTFVATGVDVPAGSVVQASGTVGGNYNLAYVNESLWGNYIGNGGSNDKKVGILVPPNTLVSNDDTLECQTVLRVTPTTGLTLRNIYIKVSPNNSSSIVTTAASFSIPFTNTSGNVIIININCKIQRTDVDKYRSKSECFVSVDASNATLFSEQLAYSYVCATTSNITMTSGSWSNNQYIVVIADDEATPVIEVINHDVKVIKKL